mgnify:CR=1 FL=1
MHSETFGERIRRLRMEKGWNLRQLAGSVDFDASSLSKIERNEMLAPPKLIHALARSLDEDYKALQVKYLSERLYYELKQEDYALEALDIAQHRLEREQSGTTFQTQKDELLRRIRQYLSKHPIEKAWLFGSFAREEESYDSDIDLLVEFSQPNPLDLFDYVSLRQDLEAITGRQIDLVESGYIVPHMESQLNESKKLIYERKAG